jgi:hypothetical protein
MLFAQIEMPFDATAEIDSLLQMNFTVPTAAMSRHRPFGRGSPMGTFGRELPVSVAAPIAQKRSCAPVLLRREAWAKRYPA